MKAITLLHNPKAGDRAHSKDALIALLESRQYSCTYCPLGKNWALDVDPETEFIVVAGGDGTIRKVVTELLQHKETEKKIPLAILPLGTANNIARSLNIQGTMENIIDSWEHNVVEKYDIGRIHNLPQHTFFIESIGFGVFPAFLRRMAKMEDLMPEDPDKQIKVALKEFGNMIARYKPKHCDLVIDGKDHSGDYLLVEIMNTESIGPALKLNPQANISDGKLDVILVPATRRQDLEKYISARRGNAKKLLQLERIPASAVTIAWQGARFHVDDRLVKNKKGNELKISVLNSFIEFMVPTHPLPNTL
jgi:diacylglycerol kinase (ATP)